MRCTNNSLRERNRTRLQVEALEDRKLMTGGAPALGIGVSTSGFIFNRTLTVQGTDHNDRIQINDDGTRIHVFGVNPSGSYQDLGVYLGISNVVINTKGGDDVVKYEMHGTSPLDMNGPNNFAIRHNITANMGDGNDTFSADVVTALVRPNQGTSIGDLGTNSNLGIKVNDGAGDDVSFFRAGIIGANSGVGYVADGGTGADEYFMFYGRAGMAMQFNAFARAKFTGDAGNDVGAVQVYGDMTTNSSLSTDLEGGDGRDFINVDYSGTLNGNLNIFETGDNDGDSLLVDLELGKFSSFGRVSTTMLADGGNDTLSYIAHKANPNSGTSLSAFLDGGSGVDSAHVHGAVTVNNIETVTQVS